MADFDLLYELDIAAGGDGTPSVVSTGQSWRFKGFTPEGSTTPQSGTFIVDTVSGTYNIGDTVGTDDSPIINIDASAKGVYAFEYYIPSCDVGTTLFLNNIECVVCVPGIDGSFSVCNTCNTNINLFDYLDGGPVTTGTWSQLSGPGSPSISGGHLGTINFNGVAAGSYVFQYEVTPSCTSEVTVEVLDPDAGTNASIERCDDSATINLQALTGGDPGTWSVDNLPPGGVFDPQAATYTPGAGDASSFTTATTYVFTKVVTVQDVAGECETTCEITSTVTVNVFKRWKAGQNSINNEICNDGTQTRNARDLLQGEDSGGTWEFFGFLTDNNGFVAETDMLINGVLTHLDIFDPVIAGGADNFTFAVPVGSPTGDIRFRYQNDNANCNSLSQIGFDIIDCGGGTCNNSVSINITDHGGNNCVSANSSVSATSPIASQVWSYRTSPSGSYQSYTSGTQICGNTFVEFRVTVSFSDGCPPITVTKIWEGGQTGCNNTPDVTHTLGTCQITLVPTGTNNSPVNSDIIQWRGQGSINWITYTGPINFSVNSYSIEYRRQVSYLDGCAPVTTSIKTATGTCGSSNCSVNVTLNGSTLTAIVSNCNQSISYQWEFSSNGTSGWSNLGTGQSQGTTQGTGYYRVTVTCGAGSCQDTYFYQSQSGCTNTVSLTYNGSQLQATVNGCSGSISYVWQFSTTGSGWQNISGSGPNLTPANGPGYYRVITWCDGVCPKSDTIQITSNCNNTPDVTHSVDNNACTITLIKTGVNDSPVDQDTIYWSVAGANNYQTYTGPIPFFGSYSINYYRAVSYTDQCPTVSSGVKTASGNCNQTLCTITVTKSGSTLTATANCGSTITWHYSSSGNGGWQNIGTGTSISTSQGNGYYRASITCNGESCQAVYQVSDCNNSPDVTGSASNCQFTLTKTGTNTSPISQDILEWRYFGSTTWNVYTGPTTVNAASSQTIQFRRRVLYSDGCPEENSGNKLVTVNCSTACSVHISQINGNTVRAIFAGCGSISYQWEYSANGTSGWINLGTGQDQTISQGSGTYRVTITCGTCTDSATIVIQDCTSFSGSASYSCATGLSFVANGGLPPYSSTPNTGTFLPDGTHPVTIYDAAGCQISDSVVVACGCAITPGASADKRCDGVHFEMWGCDGDQFLIQGSESGTPFSVNITLSGDFTQSNPHTYVKSTPDSFVYGIYYNGNLQGSGVFNKCDNCEACIQGNNSFTCAPLIQSTGALVDRDFNERSGSDCLVKRVSIRVRINPQHSGPETITGLVAYNITYSGSCPDCTTWNLLAQATTNIINGGRDMEIIADVTSLGITVPYTSTETYNVTVQLSNGAQCSVQAGGLLCLDGCGPC